MADIIEKPPCMKHDQRWRNRTQYLINQLRVKLIPSRYVNRFVKLVCTCNSTDRHNQDGTWQNVSNALMKEALQEVHSYCGYGTDNKNLTPQAQTIKTMLHLLIQYKGLVTPISNNTSNIQSSAMRMIYLLQRCINNDMTMLEHHPSQPGQQPKKKKMSVRFDLEGVEEDDIKTIIGPHGSTLQPFRRSHDCGVILAATTQTQVIATIEKNCHTEADIEPLKQKLQEFVNTIIATAKHSDQDSDHDDTTLKAECNLSHENQTIYQRSANQQVESVPKSCVQQELVTSCGVQVGGTVCLVHNRHWVAVYQYTLTQMFIYTRLEKKQGHSFTRHICTCNQPIVDPQRYFPSDTLNSDFQNVEGEMEGWPAENRCIIEPLLQQIRLKENSIIFQSLLKFVFYFKAVIDNTPEAFSANYLTPETQHSPRLALLK